MSFPIFSTFLAAQAQITLFYRWWKKILFLHTKVFLRKHFYLLCSIFSSEIKEGLHRCSGWLYFNSKGDLYSEHFWVGNLVFCTSKTAINQYSLFQPFLLLPQKQNKLYQQKLSAACDYIYTWGFHEPSNDNHKSRFIASLTNSSPGKSLQDRADQCYR